MKILIFGSKGWIGSQLVEYLTKNEIQHVKSSVHVENLEEVEKELNEHKPTHVLSLIGRTHGKIGDKVFTTIDYLEEDGKLVENVRDNLFCPISLSILCEKYQIHYTYLGTGCIFEYDETHPFQEENNGFDEDSLPNFFGSSYSIVKGFTDQLMHLMKNTLNVRIRMPINAENNPRNFISKITTYKKICSIANSMTVLPELLPLMVDMMKNNRVGTVNLTNPGLISHNEILEMYREIVDPEFKWENFTVYEQNKILSSKRSNNYLDTTKLQTWYPNVLSIKDAVRKCLEQYPKPQPNLNNIKLLVTGGCGFIGSNFINRIYAKYNNINIVNIDAMYYCADENNVNEEIRKSENYKLVKGNICSSDLVSHVLSFYQITHVVHFAAQSHVQNSFEDSIKFTHDNVLGTHTLLEASRKYGKLVKFIHVSTDEVYGESMLDVDEKHKTEHSILCPTNPYAATKAGAELIAQSYEHSYKMPIIITRGNNVYGSNQYPEKLIPRFMKLLREDKKVTIQGDGSCVRAFLHVNDTADAFIAILENGKLGEIYNIGCDENMEYSVIDVAKILIKMIKNTDDYDKWIEYIEDRPFNDKRYYISNDKLKKLGWRVNVEFIKGLHEYAQNQ
jgi:dTDP-glucose 4,6-dehydratase